MLLQSFLRPHCMNLSYKTPWDLLCACNFPRDNVCLPHRAKFKSGSFLNFSFLGIGLFPVHTVMKSRNILCRFTLDSSFGWNSCVVLLSLGTRWQLKPTLKSPGDGTCPEANGPSCFLPLRIPYFTLHLVSEDLCFFQLSHTYIILCSIFSFCNIKLVKKFRFHNARNKYPCSLYWWYQTMHYYKLFIAVSLFFSPLASIINF